MLIFVHSGICVATEKACLHRLTTFLKIYLAYQVFPGGTEYDEGACRQTRDAKTMASKVLKALQHQWRHQRG